MKKVLVLVFAAILASAFALAGCSSQPPSNSSSEPSSSSTETEQEYTIDYMVLVNKQNPLPEGWEDALETEKVVNSVGDKVEVESKAYNAYLELKAELEEDGIYVDLDSARRSIAEQQRIWDEFMEAYGEEYTKSHVAVPGYSEHQTGLALDLYLNVDGKDVVENNDLMTYAALWEQIHLKLAKHGFILRYLEGEEDVTGYAYEPWHIRYIDDPDTAVQIMGWNKTLEEYLGVADEAKAANAKAEGKDTAGTAEYSVNYGDSKLYSHDDIDAAAKVLMSEFNTWKGAKMKSIKVADDATCEEALTYCNEQAKDGTGPFDEAIVLVSDFHSPSEADAENTAWEPDKDYDNYTWYIARAKDGDWTLVSWGYN